jgi:hypothetical protein
MFRRRVKLGVLIASLLLAVVSAGLFVTSRFQVFLLTHTTAGEFRAASVSKGAIEYSWAAVPSQPHERGWSFSNFGRLGPMDLSFDPVTRWPVLRNGANNLLLIIPLWMLGVLATAVGVFAGMMLREQSGCRGCGYDLKGLTPGRPCPECGRMPPAAA